MNVASFDRLAYVDALKAAGVPDAQARAHAAALDTALRDTVATRSDLSAMQASLEAQGSTLRAETVALGSELRQEIAELRTELKQDMAELRGELKQDMAELRGELKQDMAELGGELKQDMAELRGELKQDISGLRSEMHGMKADMQRWTVALLLGQTALIVGLIKLL